MAANAWPFNVVAAWLTSWCWFGGVPRPRLIKSSHVVEHFSLLQISISITMASTAQKPEPRLSRPEHQKREINICINVDGRRAAGKRRRIHRSIKIRKLTVADIYDFNLNPFIYVAFISLFLRCFRFIRNFNLKRQIPSWILVPYLLFFNSDANSCRAICESQTLGFRLMAVDTLASFALASRLRL